jgi:hypothetical protein
MEKLVPLVSSTVCGPLGVVHLPRMWLKAILAEVDMLADGWFADYRGFNQIVLDTLGIDQTAFFAFMATVPTYAQTERWVRANATSLNPASIATSNTAVLTRPRPEERGIEARAMLGISDPNFNLSARLNDVDDWHCVHAWIVAHRNAVPQMTPLVSSSSKSVFGAMHVPRLWMKATLRGVGALHEDWNSGHGFDARCAEALEFDLAAACAYIHAELPSELQFEAWLLERIKLTDEKLAAHNTMIAERQKSEEKSAEERAEAGVPELAHREVIMLNDMVDWTYVHRAVLARRAARA